MTERTEHPETASLAHLDDDVAAVRNGEGRNIDPKQIAWLAAHGGSGDGWVAKTPV